MKCSFSSYSVMSQFAFALNTVVTTEGMSAEVCVDLVSGIPTNTITITLDPAPGTASGKFIHFTHLAL